MATAADTNGPDGPGHPVVRWTEDGRERVARWRSERGAPPPKRVVLADDRITADDAYGLACQGVALLWRGDFQNARQLLTAMASRVDRKARRSGQAVASAPARTTAETFNLQRQARSQRARALGMLVIELGEDGGIALRRAPDLRLACTEAYGPGQGPTVVALRELLGVNGAHEWRVRGIEVPAAGGRIHPHYGVFAPTRGEYVDLVARARLPVSLAPSGMALSTAFDVGTGTGVLAAVLARRDFARVIATDQDPRALACARENLDRLGLSGRVTVVQADLFPEGRAALVVCNPPWVPARPSSPLEHGVYDPESRMLRGFLQGLPAHLEPRGEGWLILSDLAEHLGLRSRAELLAAIAAAGLAVTERIDVRPTHPRASDPTDPLHAARAAETTSLWRLVVR
jgi:methylase of polypeptide subunit release factors